MFSRPSKKAKPARTYRKAYVPRPVKRYVQRQFDKNIEDKSLTVDLQSQWPSISTTWGEYSLFQPAQGTGPGARIGNKIKMKSITMYGILAQGSAESLLDDPYNIVRIVIASYRGQSGVQPLAGIGLNTPINKTSGVTVGSSLEWKYMDKYIPLTVTSTEKGQGDGYTPGLRTIKRFIKVPPRYSYVTFGDNTITYPDRRIILSMRSDSTATTNPGFTAGYIRVTYEDA